MPSQSIYNPTNDTTAQWDSAGNFLGVKPGNLTAPQTMSGPSSTLKQPTADVEAQNTLHNYKGNIDWGEAGRRLIGDLIPAGVNVATEGMGGAGLRALSPIKQLLAKLGTSMAGGTAVDQLLNIGKDKPLLDSGVQSGINAALGIGLPELANVGVRVPGMTRETNINRSSGGVSRTSADSTTLSKVIEELPKYIPGPNGQFGKAPVPIPVNQTSTQSNSQTGTSGQGTTNIQREVGLPGWYGHLLETIKNMESFKYNGLQGPGRGNLSALQSALAGLGFNLGADAASPPRK